MATAKRIPATFYRRINRTEPVRDWLKDFAIEDRIPIGRAIGIVEFGWPVGMPVCWPIAGRRGLWEVRCAVSDKRIARILFCIHEGRMLLLNGFIKKSQKTPDREIDLAVRRMKEITQ
jgi:phage-related protein